MGTPLQQPFPKWGLIVGVTGHRTLLEPEMTRIRAGVRAGLEALRGLTVSLASPLAEGADRLVAAEGLALGLSLIAPLPFSRLEYERDFGTPESLTQFRSMLARAEAVEVLPGLRTQEEAAYEAVGRRVLEISDGLIAVWDGLPARGRGGTGQVVGEARERGLPVWVVPTANGEVGADPLAWAEEVRARHVRQPGA